MQELRWSSVSDLGTKVNLMQAALYMGCVRLTCSLMACFLTTFSLIRGEE